MDFKILSPINLGALRLNVPRSIFWRWHNDGQVSSVKDHTTFLADKYDVEIPLPSQVRESWGTVAIITGLITHYHKYSRTTGNSELDLLVDAHEETHFLNYIEKLDLLSDAVSGERGFGLDFAKIDDGEVTAHMGAIYAFISRGIDIDRVMPFLKNPYRKTFVKATQEYFN